MVVFVEVPSAPEVGEQGTRTHGFGNGADAERVLEEARARAQTP